MRPAHACIIGFLSLLICLSATPLTAKEQKRTILTAIQTSSPITINGVSDEQAWHKATALDITVNDGTIGKVTVALKALYDQENLYLLATWPDPNHDAGKKRWRYDPARQAWHKDVMPHPLKGTALVEEDRLAIKWNINNTVDGFNIGGCAMLCHGDRMYTNENGELIDTWHWKAARGNALGYVDDKWMDNTFVLGKYDYDSVEAARHGDKYDAYEGLKGFGGNYYENKQKVKTKDGQQLEIPLYWEPGATGNDALFISQQEIRSGEAVKITDVDQVDTSSVIPGYILFRPVGSRGDVDGQGVWKDGRWTLEMGRSLVNNNPDDVQFELDKLYRFGIAVFDNTSGFDAQGVGHSISVGARTLEFGGEGSEDVSKVAIIQDYLTAATAYVKQQNRSGAHSQINQALALYVEIQHRLSALDPKVFIETKNGFSKAKKAPTLENLAALSSSIHFSQLLLQGKVELSEPTPFEKLLSYWGRAQAFVLVILGGLALFPIYMSIKILRREEFRLLGLFLILVLTPVVLEGLGRIGGFLHLAPLQNLSFMTSEYATLLWTVLMAAALLLGRNSFQEVRLVMNFIRTQQSKYTQVSATDPLTKIYNRAYFDQRLKAYIELSKRFNTPLSLLAICTDPPRDELGRATDDQEVTDQMLLGLSTILRRFTRSKADVLARLDNERFVLLSYETDAQGAHTVGERMRAEVEQTLTRKNCYPNNLTISIGVATIPDTALPSAHTLMQCAEKMLTEARGEGGNCIRPLT